MSAPPPAPGVDFDQNRLRGYLRAERPNWTGELIIERVGGGQSNPTYFLTVGGQRLVLRKQPAAMLVASAHDVQREYRILTALHPTPVPVPEPVLFCADPEVIGTSFYVMRRVDGRIFHQATLPDVPTADRRAIYLAHARVLAALHEVDWEAAGLGVLARPGSFLRRQVERWVTAWGNQRQADVARIHTWLLANLPDDERRTLIHGDGKLNNIIFDIHRRQVAAVLDWELAAIGDPMLDLGHVWAAVWATRPEEYGGVLGSRAAGVPSADDFFSAYYAAARAPQRVQPFHQVLALLRNAGIFHGIGQRAAAGIASAANAAETGRLGEIYLDRALAMLT